MQSRPLAGVFLFTCGSQPQKVSALNLSQRITRNDLPTFWSEHSAQDLCCAYELNSLDTQATRCQDNSFLDDFLIAHQDEDRLRNHVKSVVDTLETTLGWLINYKKSIITPSKSLGFLGIH